MITTLTTPTMSGKEIVDLSRKHTLYEWSAQSKVDPIPVARAKGIYFYTPEGKRFIDFNSQLMSVNIGVAAPMAYFPFSGWKNSFFGDLHGQGRDAIEFYTDKKVVVERWAKEHSRKF